MTAQQFNDWLAYAQVEPFGEVRADLRALWAGQMSVAPYQKKGSKPPEGGDFFPHLFDRKGARRRQTPQEMRAAALALVAAYGKKKQE